jgi:phage repressor protein C with HTH and peptisase S24 domain
MNAAEKIRAALREHNLDASDLARRMGLNPVSVRQHLNRGSIPAKHLQAYARALGIPVAQLIGDDPMPPMDTLPVVAEVAPITIAGIDYLALPVYDISAAAGAGMLVVENADGDAVSYSVFRQSWLRGVTSAPPDRLAVLRISGDSMWPTLHHGDSVLVDLTVTAVGRDGIYVIRLGDEVQCKRCSRHPVSGALTIASDNASYPTYQDVRPAGLSVLGRVIWTGRTV